MSPDSLYRLQVQVSIYYARQISAHLSQIQTCLCVVIGPGFDSTSPDFIRSSASHPVGPHGRLAQKTVNRAPVLGAGEI